MSERRQGPEVKAVPGDDRDSPARRWLGPLTIAATGLLVYANSLTAPFILDDFKISDNLDIRHLWPPWAALFAAPNVNRPLFGFSLALNYAISGLNVWSYHLFNVTIHILAALTLFGVVRRSLRTATLAERFGEQSKPLALAVAIIWLVHPLQTESVTYVTQRCESLMGLFYLLTLYCVIRSSDSARRRLWLGTAVIACTAGMLSKQVMITAPVVVLIYDALFLSSSLKAALAGRKIFYVGLAATWAVLAGTVAAAPVNVTAGFSVQTISPISYFLSEFRVILHYIRLALWPDPLCFDYAWPKATTAGQVVPFALIVGSLAALTLWAAVRRKPVAFTGVWFFLILSVTSTALPFSDLAFEHRMYLPLAGVVSLLVIGGYALAAHFTGKPRRQIVRLLALALVTLVVAVFGGLTLRRNVDYSSRIVMWTDVVKKRPENPRAHCNLGMLFEQRGELDEAHAQYSLAVGSEPGFAEAQSRLGAVLFKQGRLEEASYHLLESIRLKPELDEPHCTLAEVLVAAGMADQAIPLFLETLRLNDRYLNAHFMLGQQLEARGRVAEAVEQYNRELNLYPESPAVLSQLALVLATQDDPIIRNAEQATVLAAKAVDLTQAADPVPLRALAAAYAETGRFGEAVETAQKARDLADAAGTRDLAARIEISLNLYRQGCARPGTKPRAG